MKKTIIFFAIIIATVGTSNSQIWNQQGNFGLPRTTPLSQVTTLRLIENGNDVYTSAFTGESRVMRVPSNQGWIEPATKYYPVYFQNEREQTVLVAVASYHVGNLQSGRVYSVFFSRNETFMASGGQTTNFVIK